MRCHWQTASFKGFRNSAWKESPKSHQTFLARMGRWYCIFSPLVPLIRESKFHSLDRDRFRWTLSQKNRVKFPNALTTKGYCEAYPRTNQEPTFRFFELAKLK